ncbi:hypothetical protein F4801DRAFT_584794 [Xylaria longipes]|nr:hypothetical protein F4801DRAFT_584794 [Xylaria longipes]
MCRRIITHRMHHDVAAAMIMDPISPNPIVYANPLRTNFHRCELELPHPQRLVNSPFLKCSYHTCCVCDERAEYCDGSIAYLDSKGKEEDHQKPEECNSFILEHHHERLPYFGDEAAYPTAVPATWRGMVRIRGSNEDLFPGAAHRASWEEECFAECEKLYTLKNDTAILYDSMQDQRVHFPFHSWEAGRAARANLLNFEGKLYEQRRLVFDMWASISFNGFLKHALSTMAKGMNVDTKDIKSEDLRVSALDANV